jgi:hypothetical protein
MDMIRSEAMRSANDAVPKTLQPFRYVLVPTFDAVSPIWGGYRRC